MTRKSEVSLILVLLLSSSLRHQALASGSVDGLDSRNQQSTADVPEQRASIFVLVYNYAHLSAETLEQVRDRASLIFRKAGVEVEWADCPLKDEDPSLYPGCPEVINQAHVSIRIFPQTAARIQEGGEAFVAARIANIFWNRLEAQARLLKAPAPRLMAHTLAHELGHLLLGSNSHAPTGIMSAHWDTQVLTRICQEGLYFNNQQSEFIRSELRRRHQQEAVVENPRLVAQK